MKLPNPGTDAIIQLVLAFNEALNTHDPEAMLRLLTEDTVFENTDPPPDGERFVGKAAVGAFWSEFFRSAQGQHIEIEEIFAAGNRCVMRWVYRWQELDGKEELAQQNPAGHVRGVDVYTVRDGLIAEKLSYVKG